MRVTGHVAGGVRHRASGFVECLGGPVPSRQWMQTVTGIRPLPFSWAGSKC